MKTLIKANFITAILGWLFVVIAAGFAIRDEGGLPAFASLCLAGVATFITIVDIILSVEFIKKEKTSFLSIISAAFWGFVLLIYGLAMVSPNPFWQSRIVLGLLVATAVFKIVASVSILKYKARLCQ